MITQPDLQAAVDQLAKSERGRNAIRRLLDWLDADGLALDAPNQRAAITLLLAAWGPFPGTARDLMREAEIEFL